MSSWGANDADEAKPKFLTTAEKKDCYATPKGWVYKNPNTGLEEVIVALGALAGKLNAGDVTAVTFVTDTLAEGSVTITVDVVFNEKVVVTGTPQITVANGDESGDGNGDYTLSYASGTGTNKLRFTAATQTVSEDDVLTFGGAGSAAISLNSGTIKDNTASTVGSVTGQTATAGSTTFPTATIDNSVTTQITAATLGAVTAEVFSIAINDGGTGYTEGETVTLDLGTGTEATATVTVDGSGVIQTITLATEGAYTALDGDVEEITITGGSSSQADATVDVTLAVTSVAVSGAGTGYEGTPTVALAGTGLVQNATVTMAGGAAALATTGATAQTVTVDAAA